MKLFRICLQSLLVVTLFFTMSISAFASTQTIQLDGAIIDHNRTLIPMRVLFEALGAELEWNNSTKTVTATKNDTIISLTINSKQVTVNSNTKTLDAPPQIIDSQTMVPVRFVSETLGAKVNWDSTSSTVIVEVDNLVIYIKAEPLNKKQLSKAEVAKLIETADDYFLTTIQNDVVKIEKGMFGEKGKQQSLNGIQQYYSQTYSKFLLDIAYDYLYTEPYYLILML